MKQLMHSFQGTYPPQAILDGVKNGQIAAFCLFSGINGRTPEEIRGLTEALREAAAKGGQLPPLIGIDQEGGQLIAVNKSATQLPGNMALGATGDEELAEKAGYVLGRELLAMGVNINFAPALDINNNPNNPVIGVRSFGDTPELVGRLGAAIIRGMQQAGIIATAKHFPGHGDINADTHLATVTVSYDTQRLYEVEIAPFKKAIEAGVAAVMSGHVTYTALDPEWPATLSRRILRGLLRDELGFKGICITDAMDMQGVAYLGKEASVKAALNAGADLILLGHLEGQLEMMEQFAGMVNAESIARIEAAQRQMITELPDLSIVGCEEHRTIAQTIADRSITVVHDKRQLLPLQADSIRKIAVITPKPVNLTPADTSSRVQIELANAIRKRHGEVIALEVEHRPDGDDRQAALEAAEESDAVIVATVCADQVEEQAALVQALHATGKPVIAVSLRTPYDIMGYPMIETYLCAYGNRLVSMEAVAKVIFGEIEATGTLPCAIPGISPTYSRA